MTAKLSQKEFEQKSNIVHDYKYDYSKSIYINKRSKVCIICSIHGEFERCAGTHMSGWGGCSKCSGIDLTKLSQGEFETRSNIAHNYKYDYSKSVYTNKRSKICIICPIHGEFKQAAERHMSGRGCYKCGIDMRVNTRISKRNFVLEAQKIHGNKYDYSVSNYKGTKRKIEIICPKHGKFTALAGNHLFRKSGCIRCAVELRTPNCRHFISKVETKWLDSLNIKYRNVFIKLGDKRINVDGFDSRTNTIYEFYGDYWHGNPKKFNANDINQNIGITFGELYLRTIERENALKQLGYNIVSIWECDWKIQSSSI